MKVKLGICPGQQTCMREWSSSLTTARGQRSSGRTTFQAAGRQDQTSIPWPLWLLVLLCPSLYLCWINQLATLLLYHSKAEPCPYHWETLTQPWSLMGSNRCFICFHPLLIKNLLKYKFWTLANWGSPKCIMKMSLSHAHFLPSFKDHCLLFPPVSVPSIALYSKIIFWRNPDFRTPSLY